MGQHDSAGRQAREVVGLYGDPDTTWGIGLELGFSSALAVREVEARLAPLVADHPHLGPVPGLDRVPVEDWERQREALAASPYRVDGPLVRVALADDGGRLFVAAHHGVCDGLGLVAIADRLTRSGLASRARGIGDLPAPRSFVRSSVARLNEAIWRPPPRFAPHRPAAGEGEHLALRTLPRLGAGTVDLCLALAAVFREWHRASARSRPLLVMGASRRRPGTLEPDRQTAYLRLRVDPGWDRDQVRSAFRSLPPEPEFPETSVGGIAPRVTHLLRGRLGATAQLSNLGVVEGTGLEYAAMFPAVSGPRGVAVGLVSTERTTTVSVRTRRTEFAPADSDELLGMVAEQLAAARPPQ